MKKVFGLIFFYCLSFFYGKAQDFPDFGMPLKEELELKECAFEKDAPAVVLMDEAFSYSEDDLRLITTHHIKIKILKPSGVNVANISIPFFRFKYFESIIALKAVSINTSEDGQLITQKLGKKSFYTSKVNELMGEVSFAFPSVKVGTIIEYQYQSVMQNYWGLRDWYFQRDIPVLFSRYHLKSIFSKQFSYKLFKSPGMEITVLPEKDRIFFEMQNIPALTAEPFMDAKEDYLQRVNFTVGDYNSRWRSSQVSTYTSTWKTLNAEILSNRFFGPNILRPITGATGFIDSIKDLSKMEKMSMIYKYVKDRMNWNHVNDFLADDVSKVWEKKNGSSGDINMILMNLLNKVQLEVYPILVSKRFNGKVDSTYPNVDQFNSLMTCVVINQKKYILDATEKYYSCDLIPETVLNTTGFLIDRFSGELLKIRTDSVAYKEAIRVDMQLKDDDTLKGVAVINNYDYAKIEKLKKYKTDTTKLQDHYLLQKDLVINIAAFEVKGIDTAATSLDEKIEFSAPLYGSGQYKYIPTDLFTMLDKNPFIADNRFSSINFGYNRVITIKENVNIPDKYIIEALPEKISLYDPELNIRFIRNSRIIKETNTIAFDLTIEFLKSQYEATDYTALKKMYKTIFNKLTEQIVLKIK